MKLSDDLNHELPKPVVDEAESQSVDETEHANHPFRPNNAMVTTPSVDWSSIDMSQQSIENGGPSHSDASTVRSTGSVMVRQDTLVDTPAVLSKRPGLAMRPMQSTYVCIKEHLPSRYRFKRNHLSIRYHNRFTQLYYSM